MSLSVSLASIRPTWKTKVLRPLAAKPGREPRRALVKSCLLLIPIYPISFIYIDLGGDGPPDFLTIFQFP